MADKATHHTIAVIGAGFTGIAITCNLLALAKECHLSLKVILIGDASGFGGGLAYRVEDDNLVLNVPIGNMSAFPTLPNDFLDFCQHLDSALISGSFVSRRIYGQYLHACLDKARACTGQQLVEITDTVLQVMPLQEHIKLEFRLAEAVLVDRVILALGHLAPNPLRHALGDDCFDGTMLSAKPKANPLESGPLHRLPDDKPVLIVGTGHTAVDTLFRLSSNMPQRMVYMVSRHGLLPAGHRNAGEFVKLPHLKDTIERAIAKVLASRPKVRVVLSELRQLAKAHAAAGGNWRDVINSLRSITPDIWAALPARERRQFLRHVVSYWDAVRHRLAPVATRRLDQLLNAGRAEVIAGRITSIEVKACAELHVTVALRARQGTRVLKVGAVVNCTGPNYDVRKSSDPLVRNLLEARLIRPDPCGLGIEVDAQYRCSRLHNLYYAGPMLRALYWEATAVPELRQHAAELAKQVVADAARTLSEAHDAHLKSAGASLAKR